MFQLEHLTFFGTSLPYTPIYLFFLSNELVLQVVITIFTELFYSGLFLFVLGLLFFFFLKFITLYFAYYSISLPFKIKYLFYHLSKKLILFNSTVKFTDVCWLFIFGQNKQNINFISIRNEFTFLFYSLIDLFWFLNKFNSSIVLTYFWSVFVKTTLTSSASLIWRFIYMYLFLLKTYLSVVIHITQKIITFIKSLYVRIQVNYPKIYHLVVNFSNYLYDFQLLCSQYILLYYYIVVKYTSFGIKKLFINYFQYYNGLFRIWRTVIWWYLIPHCGSTWMFLKYKKMTELHKKNIKWYNINLSDLTFLCKSLSHFLLSASFVRLQDAKIPEFVEISYPLTTWVKWQRQILHYMFNQNGQFFWTMQKKTDKIIFSIIEQDLQLPLYLQKIKPIKKSSPNDVLTYLETLHNNILGKAYLENFDSEKLPFEIETILYDLHQVYLQRFTVVLLDEIKQDPYFLIRLTTNKYTYHSKEDRPLLREYMNDFTAIIDRVFHHWKLSKAMYMKTGPHYFEKRSVAFQEIDKNMEKIYGDSVTSATVSSNTFSFSSIVSKTGSWINFYFMDFFLIFLEFFFEPLIVFTIWFVDNAMGDTIYNAFADIYGYHRVAGLWWKDHMVIASTIICTVFFAMYFRLLVYPYWMLIEDIYKPFYWRIKITLLELFKVDIDEYDEVVGVILVVLVLPYYLHRYMNINYNKSWHRFVKPDPEESPWADVYSFTEKLDELHEKLPEKSYLMFLYEKYYAPFFKQDLPSNEDDLAASRFLDIHFHACYKNYLVHAVPFGFRKKLASTDTYFQNFLPHPAPIFILYDFLKNQRFYSLSEKIYRIHNYRRNLKKFRGVYVYDKVLPLPAKGIRRKGRRYDYRRRNPSIHQLFEDAFRLLYFYDHAHNRDKEGELYVAVHAPHFVESTFLQEDSEDDLDDEFTDFFIDHDDDDEFFFQSSENLIAPSSPEPFDAVGDMTLENHQKGPTKFRFYNTQWGRHMAEKMRLYDQGKKLPPEAVARRFDAKKEEREKELKLLEQYKRPLSTEQPIVQNLVPKDNSPASYRYPRFRGKPKTTGALFGKKIAPIRQYVRAVNSIPTQYGTHVLFVGFDYMFHPFEEVSKIGLNPYVDDLMVLFEPINALEKQTKFVKRVFSQIKGQDWVRLCRRAEQHFMYSIRKQQTLSLYRSIAQVQSSLSSNKNSEKISDDNLMSFQTLFGELNGTLVGVPLPVQGKYTYFNLYDYPPVEILSLLEQGLLDITKLDTHLLEELIANKYLNELSIEPDNFILDWRNISIFIDDIINFSDVLFPQTGIFKYGETFHLPEDQLIPVQFAKVFLNEENLISQHTLWKQYVLQSVKKINEKQELPISPESFLVYLFNQQNPSEVVANITKDFKLSEELVEESTFLVQLAKFIEVLKQPEMVDVYLATFLDNMNRPERGIDLRLEKMKTDIKHLIQQFTALEENWVKEQNGLNLDPWTATFQKFESHSSFSLAFPELEAFFTDKNYISLPANIREDVLVNYVVSNLHFVNKFFVLEKNLMQISNELFDDIVQGKEINTRLLFQELYRLNLPTLSKELELLDYQFTQHDVDYLHTTLSQVGSAKDSNLYNNDLQDFAFFSLINSYGPSFFELALEQKERLLKEQQIKLVPGDNTFTNTQYWETFAQRYNVSKIDFERFFTGIELASKSPQLPFNKHIKGNSLYAGSPDQASHSLPLTSLDFLTFAYNNSVKINERLKYTQQEQENYLYFTNILQDILKNTYNLTSNQLKVLEEILDDDDYLGYLTDMLLDSDGQTKSVFYNNIEQLKKLVATNYFNLVHKNENFDNEIIDFADNLDENVIQEDVQEPFKQNVLPLTDVEKNITIHEVLGVGDSTDLDSIIVSDKEFLAEYTRLSSSLLGLLQTQSKLEELLEQHRFDEIKKTIDVYSEVEVVPDVDEEEIEDPENPETFFTDPDDYNASLLSLQLQSDTGKAQTISLLHQHDKSPEYEEKVSAANLIAFPKTTTFSSIESQPIKKKKLFVKSKENPFLIPGEENKELSLSEWLKQDLMNSYARLPGQQKRLFYHYLNHSLTQYYSKQSVLQAGEENISGELLDINEIYSLLRQLENKNIVCLHLFPSLLYSDKNEFSAMTKTEYMWFERINKLLQKQHGLKQVYSDEIVQDENFVTLDKKDYIVEEETNSFLQKESYFNFLEQKKHNNTYLLFQDFLASLEQVHLLNEDTSFGAVVDLGIDDLELTEDEELETKVLNPEIFLDEIKQQEKDLQELLKPLDSSIISWKEVNDLYYTKYNTNTLHSFSKEEKSMLQLFLEELEIEIPDFQTFSKLIPFLVQFQQAIKDQQNNDLLEFEDQLFFVGRERFNTKKFTNVLNTTNNLRAKMFFFFLEKLQEEYHQRLLKSTDLGREFLESNIDYLLIPLVDETLPKSYFDPVEYLAELEDLGINLDYIKSVVQQQNTKDQFFNSGHKYGTVLETVWLFLHFSKIYYESNNFLAYRNILMEFKTFQNLTVDEKISKLSIIFKCNLFTPVFYFNKNDELVEINEEHLLYSTINKTMFEYKNRLENPEQYAPLVDATPDPRVGFGLVTLEEDLNDNLVPSALFSVLKNNPVLRADVDVSLNDFDFFWRNTSNDFIIEQLRVLYNYALTYIVSYFDPEQNQSLFFHALTEKPDAAFYDINKISSMNTQYLFKARNEMRHKQYALQAQYWRRYVLPSNLTKRQTYRQRYNLDIDDMRGTPYEISDNIAVPEGTRRQSYMHEETLDARLDRVELLPEHIDFNDLYELFKVNREPLPYYTMQKFMRDNNAPDPFTYYWPHSAFSRTTTQELTNFLNYNYFVEVDSFPFVDSYINFDIVRYSQFQNKPYRLKYISPKKAQQVFKDKFKILTPLQNLHEARKIKAFNYMTGDYQQELDVDRMWEYGLAENILPYLNSRKNVRPSSIKQNLLNKNLSQSADFYSRVYDDYKLHSKHRAGYDENIENFTTTSLIDSHTIQYKMDKLVLKKMMNAFHTLLLRNMDKFDKSYLWIITKLCYNPVLLDPYISTPDLTPRELEYYTKHFTFLEEQAKVNTVTNDSNVFKNFSILAYFLATNNLDLWALFEKKQVTEQDVINWFKTYDVSKQTAFSNVIKEPLNEQLYKDNFSFLVRAFGRYLEPFKTAKPPERITYEEQVLDLADQLTNSKVPFSDYNDYIDNLEQREMYDEIFRYDNQKPLDPNQNMLSDLIYNILYSKTANDMFENFDRFFNFFENNIDLAHLHKEIYTNQNLVRLLFGHVNFNETTTPIHFVLEFSEHIEAVKKLIRFNDYYKLYLPELITEDIEEFQYFMFSAVTLLLDLYEELEENEPEDNDHALFLDEALDALKQYYKKVMSEYKYKYLLNYNYLVNTFELEDQKKEINGIEYLTNYQNLPKELQTKFLDFFSLNDLRNQPVNVSLDDDDEVIFDPEEEQVFDATDDGDSDEEVMPIDLSYTHGENDWAAKGDIFSVFQAVDKTHELHLRKKMPKKLLNGRIMIANIRERLYNQLEEFFSTKVFTNLFYKRHFLLKLQQEAFLLTQKEDIYGDPQFSKFLTRAKKHGVKGSPRRYYRRFALRSSGSSWKEQLSHKISSRKIKHPTAKQLVPKRRVKDNDFLFTTLGNQTFVDFDLKNLLNENTKVVDQGNTTTDQSQYFDDFLQNYVNANNQFTMDTLDEIALDVVKKHQPFSVNKFSNYLFKKSYNLTTSAENLLNFIALSDSGPYLKTIMSNFEYYFLTSKQEKINYNINFFLSKEFTLKNQQADFLDNLFLELNVFYNENRGILFKDFKQSLNYMDKTRPYVNDGLKEVETLMQDSSTPLIRQGLDYIFEEWHRNKLMRIARKRKGRGWVPRNINRQYHSDFARMYSYEAPRIDGEDFYDLYMQLYWDRFHGLNALYPSNYDDFIKNCYIGKADMDSWTYRRNFYSRKRILKRSKTLIPKQKIANEDASQLKNVLAYFYGIYKSLMHHSIGTRKTYFKKIRNKFRRKKKPEKLLGFGEPTLPRILKRKKRKTLRLADIFTYSNAHFYSLRRDLFPFVLENEIVMLDDEDEDAEEDWYPEEMYEWRYEDSEDLTDGILGINRIPGSELMYKPRLNLPRKLSHKTNIREIKDQMLLAGIYNAQQLTFTDLDNLIQGTAVLTPFDIFGIYCSSSHGTTPNEWAALYQPETRAVIPVNPYSGFLFGDALLLTRFYGYDFNKENSSVFNNFPLMKDIEGLVTGNIDSTSTLGFEYGITTDIIKYFGILPPNLLEMLIYGVYSIQNWATALHQSMSVENYMTTFHSMETSIVLSKMPSLEKNLDVVVTEKLLQDLQPPVANDKPLAPIPQPVIIKIEEPLPFLKDLSLEQFSQRLLSVHEVGLNKKLIFLPCFALFFFNYFQYFLKKLVSKKSIFR